MFYLSGGQFDWWEAEWPWSDWELVLVCGGSLQHQSVFCLPKHGIENNYWGKFFIWNQFESVSSFLWTPDQDFKFFPDFPQLCGTGTVAQCNCHYLTYDSCLVDLCLVLQSLLQKVEFPQLTFFVQILQNFCEDILVGQTFLKIYYFIWRRTTSSPFTSFTWDYFLLLKII